ncbi:dioxygenase [Pycnococcus provasolii]
MEANARARPRRFGGIAPAEVQRRRARRSGATGGVPAAAPAADAAEGSVYGTEVRSRRSVEDLYGGAARGFEAVTDERTGEPCVLLRGGLPLGFPQSGALLRNGPNPRWAPAPDGTHPFEGDGMVHRVEFGAGGRVTYSNRFVRTDALVEEERRGGPIFSGIGFVQGSALWRNLAGNLLRGGAVQKPVSNTSVLEHGGKLLSLNEANKPVELCRTTLESLGQPPFASSLLNGMCAHSRVCVETGELVLHGCVYVGPSGPGLDYGVVSPGGEFVHRAFVPLPRASVMHDMAVLRRWTVLIDSPLSFSLARLASGKRSIEFERGVCTRFGLLPRYGGADDIQWVTDEGEPFHVFHLANAFEEGDELVLLGCRLPGADLNPEGDGQLAGGTADLGILHEWRIDLRTMQLASQRQLQEVGSDLPRVRDSLSGRPCRFCYSVRFAEEASKASSGPVFDALLKYDRQTGETTAYDPGEGRYSGEAVFVARPGSDGGEDDGWLLSFVYDVATDSSELVVIDATTMREDASFAMPRRVPFGFHGTWLGE